MNLNDNDPTVNALMNYHTFDTARDMAKNIRHLRTLIAHNLMPQDVMQVIMISAVGRRVSASILQHGSAEKALEVMREKYGTVTVEDIKNELNRLVDENTVDLNVPFGGA